jgi:hypothetical protein
LLLLCFYWLVVYIEVYWILVFGNSFPKFCTICALFIAPIAPKLRCPQHQEARRLWASDSAAHRRDLSEAEEERQGRLVPYLRCRLGTRFSFRYFSFGFSFGENLLGGLRRK